MSLNGLKAKFNHDMTQFEISHNNLRIAVFQRDDNTIEIHIHAPIGVSVKRIIEKEE